MNDKALDNLVGQLAQDLEPVQRLHNPFWLGIGWIAGACCYAAFMVLVVIGLRDDFMTTLGRAGYVTELILSSIIFLAASGAGFYLIRPGARSVSLVTALPMIGLVLFGLWHVAGMYMGDKILDMNHQLAWHDCLLSALLLFIAPAIGLTYITAKQGVTTHPVMLASMNSLAVAAYGYVGLRLSCPLDDFTDDIIYHILPLVFLGMSSAALAKRFFRW